MPLFTYIVTFKGGSHVAQGRHSNFKGFVSTWCSSIPHDALPELTAAGRKDLQNKAYQGEFVSVSNAKNVWRKSIRLDSGECVVVAVQTEK